MDGRKVTQAQENAQRRSALRVVIPITALVSHPTGADVLRDGLGLPVTMMSMNVLQIMVDVTKFV